MQIEIQLFTLFFYAVYSLSAVVLQINILLYCGRGYTSIISTYYKVKDTSYVKPDSVHINLDLLADIGYKMMTGACV